MAVQSLKSFFPTAQDVLDADLPRRGGVLLTHLKSYEGAGTVYQYNGGINREYFFAIMERRNVGLGPLPNNEPEYGADQPKVSMAFREAWNWLEKESYLIHTPGQPVLDWFSITPSGEEFLKRAACFERWEKLTLDRVRSDLENNEGRRTRGVGSGPEELDWAWEWVRMKENKPSLKRGAEKSTRDLKLGKWTIRITITADFQSPLRGEIELTVYKEPGERRNKVGCNPPLGTVRLPIEGDWTA